MAENAIELVLMRQLSEYLAMPVFLVDTAGNLLFYNEAAESILGRRFDETGRMEAEVWATAFVPTDGAGAPLAADSLPLMEAVREGRAGHRDMWIRGLDGVRRHIEVTAFPLVGQGGRRIGAVAMFWQADER